MANYCADALQPVYHRHSVFGIAQRAPVKEVHPKH